MWPVKDDGDGGGGNWLVRMEWRPAGWSVCLPLLIFPCTMKSRSSFLAPAHPGSSGKRAVKRWWWCGGVCLPYLSVCVFVCPLAYLKNHMSTDDSAIHYVLPVLWMTSSLRITRQIQIQAIGELFTATRQVAPRAKSAVVDCLVVQCV